MIIPTIRRHCYLWDIPMNLEVLLGKNVSASLPPKKIHKYAPDVSYINEPLSTDNVRALGYTRIYIHT